MWESRIWSPTKKRDESVMMCLLVNCKLKHIGLKRLNKPMDGRLRSAGVVKLADTLDLGSSGSSPNSNSLDSSGVAKKLPRYALSVNGCHQSTVVANILISKTES